MNFKYSLCFDNWTAKNLFSFWQKSQKKCQENERDYEW